MYKYILVGIGGFIGVCLRYSATQIKICNKPFVNTLIINFLGCILIGMIDSMLLEEKYNLLLKTGLCGGFTTFSTFSLETFNMIQSNKLKLGALYILSSLTLCVFGVYIGKTLVKLLTNDQ